MADRPTEPPTRAVTYTPVGQGRRIFRNTLVNGFGLFFTLVVGFALIPFSISHVGSDSYGVWLLALSFSLTGGYLSLSDLGLNESLVKFVAEAHASGNEELVSQMVSSALAVLAVMAVVAAALLGLMSVFGPRLFRVPPGLTHALGLLFILLAAEAVLGLPAMAFQGMLAGLQQFVAVRIIDVIRQAVIAAVIVAGLTIGWGLMTFGIAYAVGAAAALCGYVFAARTGFPALRLAPRHVRRSALRRLLGFGGWVFVGKTVGVIWRQMDRIILAMLVSTSLLTGYEIANRIQGAASVTLTLTGSAILPSASALWALGEVTRLRDLLNRGTRYTLALALPVAIGAIILAPTLIAGWVGPHFVSMSTPTRLFLLYLLVSGTATIANSMLVAMGRVRTVTLYVIGAAAINLVVSVALARRLEISGVIIGTLVGYGITAPLYIRLILKELEISAWQFVRMSVLPIVSWAILFAVVVELTRRIVQPDGLLPAFLCVVPGLVVYGVGVAAFSMSRAERDGLRGFLRLAPPPA